MTANEKNKGILSLDAKASFSLITARVVYGINWFNISAIFPLIALEFNNDVSLLGFISAAFFAGVGIFQIPAGIFAARYNPRISAIVGITISSTAALLCGLVLSSSELIWLRFIVGVGMAFFFSSAVILIAKYGKRGFPGFSVGLMNSAHSMGGIIGIFAWIIIAQMVGWRVSLVVSGALGLVTVLLMIVTIPKGNITLGYDARMHNKDSQPAKKAEKLKISDILKLLSNRTLIYLGIILIGIQAAWAVELTFIVTYLETLGFSAELAGIIASLPLISAIVSAPLIGGFYDKVRDARTVLLICGVGASMGMVGLSLGSIHLIIISVILTGLFTGGAFTVVYERARTLLIEGVVDHRKNAATASLGANRRNIDDNDISINYPSYYDTLKVAWVNGLSLVGVLWTPVVFSSVAEENSYELAWISSAVVTALFILVPISKLSKS
ncbi:MAG: MFS transporter [Thermoproteota archaeon]|nr:MFS transporter [Thermoproteota archaeon]